MNRLNYRKIILYLAIALMVPTFIIALFYRQDYPVLGPVLAICGILLLGIVSFMDFKNKKR